MSKSSKKRRQKRKRDLEKLRGMSVLDEECSPIKPLGSSPNPLTSKHLLEHPRVTLPSDHNENDRIHEEGEAHPMSTSDSIMPQRKFIEFVLPRANGRTEQFVFNKRARERTTMLPIPETQVDGQSHVEPVAKKEETLEDILFPSKRRRLAEKFEAVHLAEETKKGDDGDGEKKTMTNEGKVDTPSAPLKPQKKKRRRSRSLEEDELNKDAVPTTNPGDTIVGKIYNTDMANRQLSGRSVEQAQK